MKNNDRKLRYSIRKRGNDEIELRHSVFDGYVRGFFRSIIVGIIILGSLMDIKHGLEPFQLEKQSIKEKFEWVFMSDKAAYPQYEWYYKMAKETYDSAQKDENLKDFVSQPSSFEEYKARIMPKTPIRNLIISLIWLPIVLMLIFIPRPRGIRINRKKRLIYWQSLGATHSIAYVPENGDPLAGINYSKFGLYAFGGHSHFSLQFWIKDRFTQKTTTMLYGVYPTPDAKHNDDILNAIRAYLSEDNPEFLNYIGNHYGVWGLNPLITFCNAFTWGIPFRHKKAEKALNEALKKWKKQNSKEKENWFEYMANQQKAINKNLSEQGLDNEIKTELNLTALDDR